MSDTKISYGKTDSHTGERWAYVDRAAAHAHPKGRMHWSFLLVAAFLCVSAVLKFMFGMEIGGLWMGVAMAAVPAFIAVLVLARAPIARVLLILFGIVTIYISIKSGGYATGIIGLIELMILVVITIYMWEGERPNLAYGYRFRSVPKPGGGDD